MQKEMYSFDDGGGRSLTLRPEGTAPVCRAYVEHGMHKLAAPVRLYYLSSFFRAERPQAGRYRQFWQLGIEALGLRRPRGRRRDDRAARDACCDASAPARRGCGSRASRARDTRAAYREELAAYLRAHADRARPGRARARRAQPAARVRLRRSRDAGRDGRRAAPDRPPRARRRRALRGRPRAARARRRRLRDRPDARARPRLLHAHRLRVHERRARRAVGRRRRRALRRPRRDARRAADAGHRLGRGSRADADGGGRERHAERARSTSSSPTTARAPTRSRRWPPRASAASRRRWSSRAAR